MSLLLRIGAKSVSFPGLSLPFNESLQVWSFLLYLMLNILSSLCEAKDCMAKMFYRKENSILVNFN